MDPLAPDVQGLATGGQDGGSGTIGDDFLAEDRRSFDQVFAAIEDDEELLVLEKGNDAGQGLVGSYRYAQAGREGALQQGRLAHRRDVEKHDAVPETSSDQFDDQRGDRRLANAARADDGDEPVLQDFLGNPVDNFGAPHHAGHHARHLPGQALPRLKTIAGAARQYTCGRCREAIADAGDVFDILLARIAVPDRPADCRDVDAQVPVRDVRLRPGTPHEFLLSDNLSGPLRQRPEEFPSATSDPDATAIPEEQFARVDKPERSEDYVERKIFYTVGQRRLPYQTRAMKNLIAQIIRQQPESTYHHNCNAAKSLIGGPFGGRPPSGSNGSGSSGDGSPLHDDHRLDRAASVLPRRKGHSHW